MHIVLANQWYPPETGGGGVATHNEAFARACVALGHQVTALSYRPNPTTPRDTMRDGVRIVRVPSINPFRFHRLPLIGRQYRFVQAIGYSRTICHALAAINRESPIDIVEFAEVNAEGFFWRGNSGGNKGSGALKRAKMVVRCHTPAYVLADYYTRQELLYDANLLGWAERRQIRHADALTAPSHDMARLIRETCGLPPDSIQVIPNAMDIQAFSPPQEKPSKPQVTVLFVGRLERAKGIEALIAAIPQVCAQVPNVQFRLVGPNRPRTGGQPYADYIGQTLAPYIAAGQVVLCGFVTDEALRDEYAHADIAVVPSLLYESFSLTCSQAMAMALPVVASRIGGIPETLGDGEFGVIVEPDNAGQLAAALVDLARNPDRRHRIGTAARQHAVTTFSAAVVAPQILDVYARTLAST
jgi:glycosyltransferase involved in cell wall biosynthesis